MIQVTIPIKLESRNKKEHWSRGHRRKKKQQAAVRFLLQSQVKGTELPVIVTITRVSPRALDEDNFLGGDAKAIRDVLADMLIPGLRPGQADSDHRITWRYEQEQVSKTYACKIKIEPRGIITVHTIKDYPT